MKKIGTTSTGSVIVEMSPTEFESMSPAALSRQIENHGPVAADMSVAEIAAYAVPRLAKLKPGKKEKVLHAIEAMFQFSGGISVEVLSQVFSELIRRKALKQKSGRIEITEPNKSPDPTALAVTPAAAAPVAPARGRGSS